MKEILKTIFVNTYNRTKVEGNPEAEEAYEEAEMDEIVGEMVNTMEEMGLTIVPMAHVVSWKEVALRLEKVASSLEKAISQ